MSLSFVSCCLVLICCFGAYHNIHDKIHNVAVRPISNEFNTGLPPNSYTPVLLVLNPLTCPYWPPGDKLLRPIRSTTSQAVQPSANNRICQVSQVSLTMSFSDPCIPADLGHSWISPTIVEEDCDPLHNQRAHQLREFIPRCHLH